MKLPRLATWLLVGPSTWAHAQLAPPVALGPSASDPTALVTLDVDRDGSVDLVGTATGEARLVWFRSIGNGAIADPETLVDGLERPALLASGDVDGDGDVDFVTLDDLGTTPQLVENLGPAAFGAPVSLGSIAGVGVAIALRDADADGDLDLFALTRDGLALFLFRGDGAGGFGPPADVLPSLAGFAGLLVDAAFDDLDGDGASEVILRLSNTPIALLQLRNTGSGGFLPPVVVAQDGSFRPVVAGDVDGDGDTDLVTSTAQRVVVHENDGLGHFASAAVLNGSDRAARSIHLLDLDGDGGEDILAATLAPPSRALFFENLGGGAFGTQTVFASGAEARIEAAAATDLDGDGRIDLAVATSFPGSLSPGVRVRWLPGTDLTGAPPFGAAIDLTRPFRAVVDVDAGDVDGDGDVDVLASPLLDPSFVGFAAQGPGAFRIAEDLGPTPGSLDAVVVRDLDGDGLADVVLGGWNGRLVVRRSLGSFAFDSPVDLGGYTLRPAVGDVDGDGDLDLVVRGNGGFGWHENLGSFQWSARQDIGTLNASLEGASVADVNGDGIPDVVTASQGVTSAETGIYVFHGNGGGSFDAPKPVALNQVTIGALVLEDLDGDGRLDVAWTTSPFGTSWSSNLGAGSFGPPTSLTSPFRPTEGLAALDVDGDGDVDLVEIDTLSGSLRLLENLGGGSFSLAPSPAPFPVATLRPVDLDRDGDEDLLALQFNVPDIVWLENLSRSAVGARYCGPAVPNASGLPGRIDVNGTDVVSRNELTLRARDLAPGTFGFFLTSQAQGLVFPVPGSIGRLCLGGAIGRYVGPGQVAGAGADGFIELPIDLTAMPTPTGFVSAVVNQTWNFQAWYRDLAASGPTSNFTDAISVLLR